MSVSQRAAPPAKWFKYVFGLHVLNGFAVAVGVFLVAVVVGRSAGFAEGMAAATGALCVSIADQPAPFAAKARILPLAWICALLAALATALTLDHPLLASAVIVLTGAAAGLLLAWGRWAIPLSVLAMLSMVFVLGAPGSGLSARLHYVELSTLGGALYIPVALALTSLLDASGRRLTLAEVLRAFAAYLRCVADFYRVGADPSGAGADFGAAYLRLVEQQVALSDHLQAARALIAGAGDRPSALRLTGGIVVLLEAFDGLVSVHADQAPLRLAAAKDGAMAPHVAELVLRLSADVERLALDLTIGQTNLIFPDHREALESIAADTAAIEADPSADPHLLRAALLTRNRFAWIVAHLAQLPAVLTQAEAARRALAGVDLREFVPPLRASLETLRREIRMGSPIFRHALRVGMALGAGYAMILLVPGLRHGNWILLTIAVIMRASYSVTRQRRNDRLLGSILGCGLAGALLWTGSPVLLFAAQLAAIGVAHAYVRVDYRVTATAATIMALLTLQLIDPVEAAPVLARLVDTVIGAGIAFLFNLILPHWERQGAPAIARTFVANLALYADRALRFDPPEQAYRLARKNLIEAMSAMSESATRMRGEPQAVRALWPEYGRLIASAYATVAQIVTVRLLIRIRRGELDPSACESVLDATRRAVLAELDLSETPADEGPGAPEAHDDSDAFAVLRQRCGEVFLETARFRGIAQEWAKAQVAP